jgi:sn-glycerol 3-phosphate transport system ATP-binding protein
MSTLSVKDLVKTYQDEQQIIKGLDLDVDSGEFIVVVGPSGCGKSTFLRMVAGLETVSSGTIAINDEVVNDKEPKDRNIAMVFQNYALYPHMTVYDNMAYGLRMRKFSKQEIDKRVQNAANILGLEELLERKPKALSGGQRQRVAMGRAIVRKPKIFLFDEPLSNLDAKLRVQMRLEIRKLQQELKTTSLYVTHDQVEAMTLADRIVILNKGKIEQVGTPLEVYSNPASKFVAGFIGSPAMNFVNVKRVDEQTIELPDGKKLRLPEKINSTDAELTMGFRPEMLKLVTEQADDLSAVFSLSAKWVEALGTDTYIYGSVDGSSELVTARISGKYHLQPGKELKFAVDPHFIYLFAKESGSRV